MAAELVHRSAILVVVYRFLGMGASDSCSLRSDSYVRMQHFVRRFSYVPCRCGFWGVYVWREFVQRLFIALHGTLRSLLRDALQEGSAEAVACMHVPRA
jgi:hypothetical protein